MRISDWSSDVCASDLSECVQFAHGHRLSRYQRQDGRDTLSEPLIRHADDQAVLHAWVSRNDLFHFFGKNLLSASIDARGVAAQRSEERRAGQEGVSKCRCRWSAYHYKKNKKINKT